MQFLQITFVEMKKLMSWWVKVLESALADADLGPLKRRWVLVVVKVRFGLSLSVFVVVASQMSQNSI